MPLDPFLANDWQADHGGRMPDPTEHQPTPEEQAAKEREKEIIDEIHENIALTESVEHEQRRREDDDLEFEGGEQWDPDAIKSREEHVDENTGRRVPARPRLTINLTEQPIQQILNEARQARISLTVKPKAGRANTKDVGYYKGLIRNLQAESGAQEVRLWALERTVKAGRGAYLIRLDYADDGDFDLDIILERILDQSAVYWDPYSKRADRADAEWAAMLDWLSKSERERRWPDKPVKVPEGAFASEGSPWFALNPLTGEESYQIATYYRVEHTQKVLAYHPSTGPMPFDQMPEEYQEAIRQTNGAERPYRTRVVDIRTVRQYIVDGTQILEEDPWPGKYIPIIATTGKERFVRGKRSWTGVVRPTMDANVGYNVALSSAMELAGSMPRSPYIMYEGQDEGYESMWDDSPVKNYVRLYINKITVGGRVLPPPQRQNIEPQIQSVMLLSQEFKNNIGSLTGAVDPAFRAVNPYDRSGKAIQRLQEQGAAGTSNYVDNLATISMPHEGRVYIDLIPKVYDRPGRIVRIMGETDDAEIAIMIKRPFIRDGDGNPVPVPCPRCQGTGAEPMPAWAQAVQVLGLARPCAECRGGKIATRQNMPKEFNGQTVEYVDLSEGQYTVRASIARNFRTKQEETMSGLSELAQAAPQLVPLYADLWVEALGFSGSKELAERIRRANPQLSEDEETKDVPPRFLARMQQLEQAHQMAMQQLQQATEALRTDQVKMEGQKEIAAMKAEAEAGLEHLKQQGKIMGQALEERADRQLTVLEGRIAAMQEEAQRRHEVLLEVLGQLGAARIEEAKRAAAATKEQPETPTS